ncbi:hypothetical protein G7Z17_g4637 [Cylindrodendrum hubeiense]|uniref:Protamine P1 n=1 Tax=Cylindrodendrum hubeiense TaxID=595255 RepID=A0A9P5HAF8_9HYPO|nr:hypothetical protein G7Z17_g4637 [Cylindrodendrum hubeiense]
MRHAGQKADVLGPSWEEDTIYCEATCAPEDVFYEGSDDEDYDDLTSRRLRYEAAGQRFLDGSTPLLLTATLKGPFDTSSGWINPWRSKHRTTGTMKGTRTSPEKLSRQSTHKRNISIPETIDVGPHDSMECHLPSPESLKQAPVADIHPYLEEDELAMVQNWRTAVQPVAKDQFWAATPKGNISERKRKARGSEWLRKLVSKRRRTELMELESINMPVPRRPGFREEGSSNRLGPNTSFCSAPGQLPSSAATATRFLLGHDGASFQSARDTDDDDELLDSVHVSFSSAPSRLQSPSKRLSPHRNAKRTVYKSRGSEDELSLDNVAMRAAATLSSPVSQQRFSQVLPRKSPRHSLSQQALAKQSPSLPPSSLTSMVYEDVADEYEMGEGDEQFETQKDESFCFRMPSKLTSAADSPVDVANQPDVIEGESWSGLSSSDQTELQPLHIAEGECVESKDQGPKIDTLSIAPDTGIVEIDRVGVSSELSSLISNDFEGFDVEAPSEADVEMASDSDTANVSHTTNSSDAASKPSYEAEDDIGVEVTNNQPGFQQVVSNEQPYHATETEDQSMSEDDTSEEDGSEESEEGSNDGTDDNIPSQVSEHEAAESVPERPIEHLQPGPLSLLKNSVKRFAPKTSWARLSLAESISSPTPTPDNEIDESSHTIIPDRVLEISTPGEVLSEHSEAANAASELAEQAHDDMDVEKSITASTPNSQASSPLPQRSEHSQEVLEHNDAMKADDANQESIPLSVSQQSPWAGTKLSQFAMPPANHIIQDAEDLSKPQVIDDASTIASTPAQIPWEISTKLPDVPQDHTPSTDNADQLSALHELATTSSSSQLQNCSTISTTPAITPAVALRATTPEPQFSVKSFASFMSPSPERRPRNSRRATWRDSGSRLPSTQGILASATKNPWGLTVSQRRVSWAQLPHEMSSPTTGDVIPSPLEARGRQLSPPPAIPIAELPTSEDAKFHDHFTAVARQTKGLRQRLLPTASQRTLGSPEAQAMAEAFLAVDQLRKPSLGGQSMDNAGSQRESERTQESQEPLDIVEDVIREMGGYLDTWNVDTELDIARKSSSMQAPQLTQSPW